MSYQMIRGLRAGIPPGIRSPFGQLPTLPGTLPATIPGCTPCPVGYLGCMPYCAVDPHYGGLPTMPGIPGQPPAPGVPPGQPPIPPVDPASLCAAAGGTWDVGAQTCALQQPPIQCPSGTTYAPGQNACVPFPGGVAPAPAPAPNGAAPAQAAVTPSWWAERTDMEKGLIIAGGGVLAFGLVYAVAR